MHLTTIVHTRDALVSKKISVRELVQEYISTIEKKKDLNALITVTSDEARAEATKWDEKIAQGESIPSLAGIPGVLKDVFCVKGIRATGASNIIRDYYPPYNATTVDRLNNEGYVLMGKANTDEFTMGASTETSAFGVTKNPFDENTVAGGSSGGSACAVATRQALFALGTDTGGSIRQPAAFCGVVGLKPTYGLVSRYGVMSMASSLDTIGPIATTVEDCAIVLDAIAGNDPHDSTTSPTKPPLYSRSLEDSLGNLTIGFVKEYDAPGMDKEVIEGFERAKELLQALGVKFKDISLPHSHYALSAYYVIVPAEVSSNLARYDGIRFGNPKDASSLKGYYLETRGQGFGTEAKRRSIIGTYVLSKGYYDAYYVQAQRVRTHIRNDFEDAFKEVDMIMAPVSPVLPFKIGEKVEDPLSMYLADIFTVGANLAGIPSLSVPIQKKGTFSVSIQLMGPHFSEEHLLRLGHHMEKIRGALV